MKTNTILYKTLARALSMKRPHDTLGTKKLTRWLVDHIPEGLTSSIDAAGNVHIDARVNKNNRTLFVAHVDTVHRITGPNKIRKTDTMWYAHADAPLGADDGAGVAMLMHLLCAGIPAYYIFTQGEECGGIGAKYVSENTKLLSQFDRAVAFDRRGIDSVITHQGYGRCCSDVFAQALSDALNDDLTLMYLPDDTGVYTDTAEFVDVIPECTNISVGYYSEHTAQERLDIVHLQALADRCLRIDWDSLPTTRDPRKHESKWDKWDDKWNGGWGSVSLLTDEDYYKEDVIDAIHDAMCGNKDFLVELMCDAVYPEDPDMARRFVNPKSLTDLVLDEALDWARTYDPETVLAALYETAHCEV